MFLAFAGGGTRPYTVNRMSFRLARMMGVLFALGAASCGTGSDFDPPADSGMPPGPPAALLAIEAPEGRSVTMLFGETAEIVVRYTEMDGSPIAGARIAFA